MFRVEFVDMLACQSSVYSLGMSRGEVTGCCRFQLHAGLTGCSWYCI